MTKTIKMEVFSRLPITPERAIVQISALSDFDDGFLRPLKCDASEPIRESFDPADLAGPAKWLSHPGGAFFFKRTKSPKVEGYIENRRRQQIETRDDHGKEIFVVPKFPEPLFLGHWTLWLDGRLLVTKGPDYIVQFLLEVVRVSQADYAYATSEDDQKAKNFLTVETETTITTKFVGTDPEQGIPGLYWVNVFGKDLTAWLGEQLFSLPGTNKRVIDGRTLLRFGQSPETSQTSEVRNMQERARAALGAGKFFDISEPGRRVDAPWGNSV